MKSSTLAFLVLAGLLVGSVFLLGQPRPDGMSFLEQQIRELQDRVEKLEDLVQALQFSTPPVTGLPEGARVQGEINGMKYYLVPLEKVPAD